MLTIYGLELSSPVNKVRFTANILGLKYELEHVDLIKGEHQTPEFLKISESGKIPAITDGDFSLFESNAICKYLARKESSDLYPEDILKQAKVDQWLDFVSMHINAAMVRLTFNRVMAPVFGAPVSEESIADGEKFLARFIPVVEEQIGANGNLASKDFSLADVALLATLDPAEVSKFSLSDYPKLSAWRDNLKKEKFYQDCHSDFTAVIEKVMGA